MICDKANSLFHHTIEGQTSTPTHQLTSLTDLQTLPQGTVVASWRDTSNAQPCSYIISRVQDSAWCESSNVIHFQVSLCSPRAHPHTHNPCSQCFLLSLSRLRHPPSTHINMNIHVSFQEGACVIHHTLPTSHHDVTDLAGLFESFHNTYRSDMRSAHQLINI